MKKLVAVLFVALAFSLFGCKGPEGPVGPAGAGGKDGKDGQNAGFVYFDGFKDSLKCSTCHTPGIDTTFYVQGRVVEWNNSKHNVGGDIDRNAANCAGCHTTEGFLDRSKMNFTTQFAWSEKLHPSPPGCFACHLPHGRGDFKLRDSVATTLTNVFVGGSDKAFDGGSKSNLCVKCHQPRNVSAVTPAPNVNAAATDTLTITSTRWYQHYGVQAQMFQGTGGNGGFQFPSPYTYSNSGHTALIQAKTLGCIDCHMQEPVGGGAAKAGGHTMWLAYEAEGTETYIVKDCKVCHSDITSGTATTLNATLFGAYKNNAVNTIKAQLDTLAGLLMDTLRTNKWTAGISKGSRFLSGGKNSMPWLSKTISAETGEASYSILAGSVSGVTYPSIKALPATKAGALWNFMFIEHDRSNGVHNYQYAKALLRASIDELK